MFYLQRFINLQKWLRYFLILAIFVVLLSLGKIFPVRSVQSPINTNANREYTGGITGPGDYFIDGDLIFNSSPDFNFSSDKTYTDDNSANDKDGDTQEFRLFVAGTLTVNNPITIDLSGRGFKGEVYGQAAKGGKDGGTPVTLVGGSRGGDWWAGSGGGGGGGSGSGGGGGGTGGKGGNGIFGGIPGGGGGFGGLGGEGWNSATQLPISVDDIYGGRFGGGGGAGGGGTLTKGGDGGGIVVIKANKIVLNTTLTVKANGENGSIDTGCASSGTSGGGGGGVVIVDAGAIDGDTNGKLKAEAYGGYGWYFTQSCPWGGAEALGGGGGGGGLVVIARNGGNLENAKIDIAGSVNGGKIFYENTGSFLTTPPAGAGTSLALYTGGVGRAEELLGSRYFAGGGGVAGGAAGVTVRKQIFKDAIPASTGNMDSYFSSFDSGEQVVVWLRVTSATSQSVKVRDDLVPGVTAATLLERAQGGVTCVSPPRIITFNPARNVPDSLKVQSSPSPPNPGYVEFWNTNSVSLTANTPVDLCYKFTAP